MAFRLIDNKQMIYIYSENSKLGRNGLEIIEAINMPIRAISLNNESLSGIIWAELGAILGKPINDFFDITKEIIKNYNNFKDYIVADWLLLIKKHPEILKEPIAINGAEAIQIKNKKIIFDFYNNALNSKEVDKHIINHKNILSQAI